MTNVIPARRRGTLRPLTRSRYQLRYDEIIAMQKSSCIAYWPLDGRPPMLGNHSIYSTSLIRTYSENLAEGFVLGADAIANYEFDSGLTPWSNIQFSTFAVVDYQGGKALHLVGPPSANGFAMASVTISNPGLYLVEIEYDYVDPTQPFWFGFGSASLIVDDRYHKVSFLVPALANTSLILGDFNASDVYIKSLRMRLVQSYATVYSGVMTGLPGPGDGRLAIRFDGVNDYVNLASNYRFWPAIEPVARNGTISFFFAAENSTVWASGSRYFTIQQVNATNRLDLRYVGSGTESYLQAYYSGVGVETTLTSPAPRDTSWHHLALSWAHVSGNYGRVRLYLDGVLVDEESRSHSAYMTGTLTTTQTCLGSISTSSPASVWFGKIARFTHWSRELTASDIAIQASLLTRRGRIYG